MNRPIILVDSGAFSCWTIGGTIDVHHYINFLKDNPDVVDRYVTLDVIAGQNGQRSCDAEEIERAAALSHRNTQIMKDAGLSPIPVYHQDESFKWLEQMVLDGETYVCLAPHGRNPRTHLDWLHTCFQILNDGTGRPRVKVHGLGTTTPVLLDQYPWTSVDSSTWVQQSKVGMIPVPIFENDKPNYSLRYDTVSVTKKSAGRHTHINAITSEYDSHCIHQFMHECGVDLAQVRDDVHCRWRVWFRWFNGLEAASGVEIFHVVDFSPAVRSILMECGARRHLLSYFKLRKMPADSLRNYVAGLVV